jgi:hypothetical protein
MNNILSNDILDLNSKTLSELKEIYKKGNLVIAVGAGASCQSGLPTWNGLIETLFDNYIKIRYGDSLVSPIMEEIKNYLRRQFGDTTPIVMTHYLQSMLKEEEFLEMVHKSLYYKFDETPLPGQITKSITKLTKNQNGIKSIITFNFDELIELALTIQSTEHTSVWLEKHLNSIKGVPVVHPHGFLPYNKKQNEPYWIVLAESDYHTQYNDLNSWSNKYLQKVFTEYTCLFVSTSITDPNLRRILDITHRENKDKFHYFLWSTPSDDEFNDKIEAISHKVYKDIFTESFNRIGMLPVWFRYRGVDPTKRDPNYNWKDIPEILNYIGS